MCPDAATLTAPEVIDHGVLAAVLKQRAFDPADGTLVLKHREEEQHDTYRIERICVRCACLSDFEHSTTTNALILLWLGGQGRNRTSDTVIFSHVLYQLSYLAARTRSSEDVRTSTITCWFDRTERASYAVRYLCWRLTNLLPRKKFIDASLPAHRRGCRVWVFQDNH
jgi:hypothetical protein